MIQGGSVIIADFEDMWGNVTNIGLGEHATRTHSPPMFFDKNGNVLRYVDFESSTPNYELFLGGTGISVNRSTDVCLTGNYSLKMHSPDAVNMPYLRIKTADFHGKTVGAQLVFSLNDLNGKIYFNIANYTGTHIQWFMLTYTATSGQIALYTNTGWPIIGTVSKYADKYTFSTFKLTGDYETGKYNKLLILGNEFDLSSHLHFTSTNTTKPHIMVEVYYTGPSGPSTMYIDNVIITENENVL